MQRRIAMIGIVAIVLGIAFAMVPAVQAGKGGGGKPPKDPTATPAPLDGGTIYYAEQGVSGAPVHAIDPDGSNDTLLAGVSGDIETKTSRLLHNGDRWFIQARDAGTGFFPGGESSGRLYEIDLFRQGDTTPVPLTDNASACIQMKVDGYISIEWAPDATGQADGAVAWTGSVWSKDASGNCDTIQQTGIFRADLTFDGAGDITGLVAQPTAPEIATDFGYAFQFSYAPDGEQVAYTVDRLLYIADSSGVSLIDTGGWAAAPAWSPDLDSGTPALDSKIAFAVGTDGTYVIDPDGSGMTRLAQGRRAKNRRQSSLLHRNPEWSPTGSHLIFSEYESTTGCSNCGPSTMSVRRMAADGSGNVVLVSDAWGIGWGSN